MELFRQTVRMEAGDEAATASALRDKAEMLESAGEHRQATVYYNAAANADDRAAVWRGLLTKALPEAAFAEG